MRLCVFDTYPTNENKLVHQMEYKVKFFRVPMLLCITTWADAEFILSVLTSLKNERNLLLLTTTVFIHKLFLSS